jgi:phosphopantetheinyl transferase
MSGHFDLMREFLASHEPVMRAGVIAARRNRDTRPPPTRDAEPSRRVMVFDLANAFSLPLEFSGYIMRGAPTLDGVLPYLAECERKEARDVAARFRHGQGWTEWSLSRLAVKRAAADLLAGHSGARPAKARIEILKRDGGSPYVAIGDPSIRPPTISIAHAVSSGVGAACDAGWRLGIDFDAPSRVRDPAGFLDTILNETEWRSLRVRADAATATTLWCLKEAAAKALGTGITGEPRRFTISAYDPASGTATVEHDGARLHAAVRRIGEGVCAVAYAPIQA